MSLPYKRCAIRMYSVHNIANSHASVLNKLLKADSVWNYVGTHTVLIFVHSLVQNPLIMLSLWDEDF